MALRGISQRVTGKAFFIEEPAANVVPADGQGFDITKVEAVQAEVLVVGGTQGSIDVTVEHADTADENANYATVPAAQLEFTRGGFWDANPKTFGFAQAGGKFVVGYGGSKKFVRIKTSGAAGTPDFKIAGSALGHRRRHIGGA